MAIGVKFCKIGTYYCWVEGLNFGYQLIGLFFANIVLIFARYLPFTFYNFGHQQK
jgi:hypothetical protein